MEEKKLTPFDLFSGHQETYEEAFQKNAEESKGFQRTKHFRIDAVGTYPVRILPIAPTLQPNGEYTLDRKGYEYPIKTQVLRIDNPKPKGKKDKQFFVNVCQSSFAGISVDLIDTYIQVAEAKYGDDEKLIKKVKSTGFEGGLKWNSQRCMYVYDMQKRNEGIQLLTLSFAQYKELEDRKLAIWKKLLEKNKQYPCPISSIANAFQVEITRKEENGKTNYTFNIDTISGCDELTAEELSTLLETTRLPEVMYRYTRFHLEATIEFLKQYDAKMEMAVMESQAIADAIEKIKLELPADDKSHFSFDKKERTGGDDMDNEENGDADELDSLWSRWEKLEERGLSDKTDEGQELRDDIRGYIEDNELNIRVTRGKSNKDLLEEIEDALENEKETPDDEEEEPAQAKEETPTPAEPENTDDPEEDDKEEESARPARRRGEHNEDTNEPAVTTERRAARPARRRAR